MVLHFARYSWDPCYMYLVHPSMNLYPGRNGNTVPEKETMAYCTVYTVQYRASICRSFKDPRNRFPAWWNRFLGSTNVDKYGRMWDK
jgi:hypothetical protein